MIQFIKKILNIKGYKKQLELEESNKKYFEKVKKQDEFMMSKKLYGEKDFLTLLKMDYHSLSPEEKVEQKYKVTAFVKKMTKARVCPICGEVLRYRDWVHPGGGTTFFCSSLKCDFSVHFEH